MANVKGAGRELLRRKRKVMLLLPVIVVPLLTVGFYALGGGRGGDDGHGLVLTKGLNMSLPEAKFDAKKKGWNKLGFYRQSDQDSMKLRERRKMDPYYRWKDSSVVGLGDGSVSREAAGALARPGALAGLKMAAAPKELQAAELTRKLELLKGALNREQAGVVPEMPAAGPAYSISGWRSSFGSQGARLGGSAGFAPDAAEAGSRRAFGSGADGGGSSIAASAGAGSSPAFAREASGGGSFSRSTVGAAGAGQGDADLDKLNAIMDKVLRVRYPSDVSLRDSAPVVPQGPPVQVLRTPAAEEVMTTLAVSAEDDLQTCFIELDAGLQVDSQAVYTIPAVVDGDQSLVSGEAVALGTAADGVLGGVKVPSGTALSGKGSLSGERLMISVSAIRIGSRVIPVALEVVDMDGMTGIRVKGSINRDVSKESAEEAVGSLGVTSLDPSVTGQATAAGIQAAKNLLSRKIRLVKVGLPAGYRVLLRNRAP